MMAESFKASGGSPLIDSLADWLMTQALGGTDLARLVEGCCQRLSAAGVPLMRALVSHRTLHPLFDSVWLTWQRDEGIGTFEMPHGRRGSEVFQRSPFFHLIDTGIPFLRRRLVGDEAVLDFPVLSEFRDKGATDYIAYLVPFNGAAGDGHAGDGIIGSWTTDRPSGFSNADIQALLRIQTRLAVACKGMIKEQIARNVLTAYLGPEAGRRVLEGNIRRGDGEIIPAVIWYSDLRDSTAMADRMPAPDFLRLLNSYFECTAGAVLANGGEVLVLIGDAVLSIFPIREGLVSEREACEKSLAAALEARARLAALNRERADAGHEPLAFGLALHVGDLMYGNIGVPERLEFTVVGPAANTAARLQTLSKSLDRPVLVSGEFARNLPLAWEPLGLHEIRGAGEPLEVLAPPPETEAAASVAAEAAG